MILSYFMEYNSSKLFLVSLKDSYGYVRILIIYVFRKMIYLRVWYISKTKHLLCKNHYPERLIIRIIVLFQNPSLPFTECLDKILCLKVTDKMQFLNMMIFLMNDRFFSKTRSVLYSLMVYYLIFQIFILYRETQTMFLRVTL